MGRFLVVSLRFDEGKGDADVIAVRLEPGDLPTLDLGSGK